MRSGFLGKWRGRLVRFLVSQDGPAAAEYAILLAMIAVVSIGTIRSIGERFYNLYTMIANSVGNVM
ncbi:MAG: Flp family type IVb pilin [Phycisphaerae bacterium]|nr:Flp family type IVb pilin [Phycisphaerae bacterium]